jgi:tetratricopeptide (TPR) repeat protein
MTNSTTPPGSKVGRARRSPGQLWQVPTFLLGLLAFVGVAVSAPWRLSPQEREFELLMSTLRKGLENDESGDALVGHAENLKLRLSYYPARVGEAQFLVGSAYYRQAKQRQGIASRVIWPHAAEHLEKALAAGVPASDRAALQYRLGYSLCQQNTDVPRALELLTLGVEKGAEQPLQGYQLLLQAHLQRTPPDLEAARSAVRRVLDLTPERDVEALASARLQHADLLLRKEMRADAYNELERISSKASRGVRVKARLLQARCCEEDGHWNKAIPIWHGLLADAAQVEGGKARIYYALGWCNQQLEPANVPESINAWSEALRLGGAEGQAAGLRLGYLRLGAMVNDPTQALADWKSALDKVNGPKDYRNAYVSIDQVRAWFEAAIDRFQDAQDPEKTQTVAELYRKITPGGAAEERVASAAEARAKQLSDKLRAKLDKVTPEEVHAQYRRAAEAHEKTASARPEAERPEPLWRSVQCYLQAKENARAQQVLDRYVKMEVKEPRLAEAWFTLGDLYRQDSQHNAAHQAFVKCIQYPNTPYAYRARYWLAVEEELDSKNLEKARAILKDNLNASPAAVEREWLEKSAFKMASLLMKMENYADALDQLKECLLQFSESSSSLVARDQLGECYYKLAGKERLRELDYQRMMITGDLSIERKRTLEDSVRQQRKKRLELLTLAVTTYQRLADDLERTLARGQLTKLEKVVLRRSEFNIGLCYLDNEDFADALQVFQKVQVKHRRTLESIIASYQICYIAGKTQKADARELAKASVRMTLDDLNSIGPDDDLFRLPGVSSHSEWLNWAHNAQRKLQAPPMKDNVLPEIR